MRNLGLIQMFGIIGCFIGSLFAGKVIKYGRRRAVLIFSVIGMVGCGVTMYLSIPTLFTGRFITGVNAGVGIVVMSKAIDESIPKSHVD